MRGLELFLAMFNLAKNVMCVSCFQAFNFRHNIIRKRLLSGARAQSNRNQDFPVTVLDLPRAVEFSYRWSRETQAFGNEIGVDPGSEVGTNVSYFSSVRIFTAVRSLNITMATFFIARLCSR